MQKIASVTATITASILLLIILAGAGYLGFSYYKETGRTALLLGERQFFMTELSSSTEALGSASSTISELTYRLSATETELQEIKKLLTESESRNNHFEGQIRNISGTVVTLDKLAKTDRELLQKYSKVYFLNENYIPAKLTQIPKEYILVGKKDQYFHGQAWKFLKEMLDDAKKDGIDLKVISAYRSFEEQSELKGQFTQQYGAGANTFSADQGYSEHQLGTTLDLTDPKTAATSESFANTPAYAWLLSNAHKYGFILSYPKDNSYYIFEPWHWRFVGEDLARDLNKADVHFYDWEQRKIDEYLVSLFD